MFKALKVTLVPVAFLLSIGCSAATLDSTGRPIPERGAPAPSFTTMHAAAVAGVDPFIAEHRKSSLDEPKVKKQPRANEWRKLIAQYWWAGVAAIAGLGALYVVARRKR